MSNTFVSSGDKINVTLTGTVTHSTIHDFTDFAGVYLNSGVSGDLVPVAVEGIFTLTKDSSTITAGQKLYSDGTDVTTTSSSNTPIGFATEAAATGAATVKVKLSAF